MSQLVTKGHHKFPRYFAKDGSLITLRAWSDLLSDRNYVRIESTETDSGLFISTVWLGLDYGFMDGDTREPLIFETMVFQGWNSLDCTRSSTVDEAHKVHSEMVAKYTKTDNIMDIEIIEPEGGGQLGG